ncbi:MAG: hypothetical protein HXY49_01245 [Ignavibacteriaceae bacterium]|nr:hypothetical protein [Ignavibacteriaceae bacterium]
MGRSKIVFIVGIFLFLQIDVYAQAEYVDESNPVYDFLERMETIQVLNDYNSFEIPKTRKEISFYLLAVLDKQEKLDANDRLMLKDFCSEFEFELYGTLNSSSGLIENNCYNFFSEKEKYLYFFSEKGKANLFINLLAEGQTIFYNDRLSKVNLSTSLGIIGGDLRGTFIDKFGFALKGTNGVNFGNKRAALLRKGLVYNFKFNEKSDESFFDETSGYLTADLDLVKFKVGRDRLKVGYGQIGKIISDDAPVFDYLGFNIRYKFFSFSYFHGKLLGFNLIDEKSISEKFIGYHRIGFNISKHLDIGLGEIVVYGNRGMDFAYLNPFAFYKSVEHSNYDRDNSMLFVDVNNNSVQRLKLFGTLLIDDISYGKIGSGWWGNQIYLNAGLVSDIFYDIFPLEFQLEYTRIEPYVFSHRFLINNFSNFNHSFNRNLLPNSELFFGNLNYRFTNRLDISLNFLYSIHGENYLNENNELVNVGGDINLGHREGDSEKVKFLDGKRTYSRNIQLEINYELINQFLLTINFIYNNQSKTGTKSTDEMLSFFTLKTRF